MLLISQITIQQIILWQECDTAAIYDSETLHEWQINDTVSLTCLTNGRTVYQ